MKIYHYHPLKDDEIRLLTLHPGYEATICCTLQHARLTPKATLLLALDPSWKGLQRLFGINHKNEEPGVEVAYDALSYSWGSQSDAKTISLNKCDFRVGSSLESALRHLRLPYNDRILWIDAICINQGDIEERDQQVLRMGIIYKRASAVRIWLGPEYQKSNEAMKWIAESPRDRLFEIATTIHPLSEQQYSRERLYGWANENYKDPLTINAQMIGAVCQLMSMPWFTRRWVIQEIAFASLAFVHCSYMGVEWKQFCEAIRMIPEIWRRQAQRYGTSWVKRTQPEFFGLQTLTDSSGYWGDPEAQSATSLLFASENVFSSKSDASGVSTTRLCNLQTLVEEFANFNVSDPRDMVYALLPLAEDSHLWNPSYNKEVIEVYQNFIIYSVQASGSLDILLRPWASSYNNLPSWVAVSNGPKFAIVGGKRLRQRAELFIGSSQSKIYNASGNLKPSIHVQNPSEELSLYDLPKLIVPGFLLDTVAEERAHHGFGNQAAGWPKWALESVLDKGTDMSQCTLDDLLRTGRFLDEDLFPVVFTCRWLVTEVGRLGLGPARTSVQDKIVIFFGCSVPVILRPEHTDSAYVIIGECFIQDVMDGEAIKGLEDGMYKPQEFLLI